MGENILDSADGGGVPSHCGPWGGFVTTMHIATGTQRSRLVDIPLTIARLETAIRQKFDGLIDMADVPVDPAVEHRRKFLTRALAAFAIGCLTDCEPAEAAVSVTDGWNDQGVDAIFFVQTDLGRRLHARRIPKTLSARETMLPLILSSSALHQRCNWTSGGMPTNLGILTQKGRRVATSRKQPLLSPAPIQMLRWPYRQNARSDNYGRIFRSRHIRSCSTPNSLHSIYGELY